MSKVLLVEDEPALLEAYREILTALGHQCVCAMDGNEAVELARQHRPDVIVADYMLPGRTGTDVARALRADPVLAATPLVLLSAGRPPEHERAEAFKFLAKPVALEQLELAVREALGASGDVSAYAATHKPDSISPTSLAREEMLNWVAHEIKTPLSAAFTATELALRDVRSGPGHDGVERRLLVVSRQLKRMDELVNSLLDAAQLRDSKLQLDVERLDLGDLTERAVGYWRDLHPEIRFEFTEGEHHHVDADPERVRQILDNLISNAIKYGRPANQITVRVHSVDFDAAVSVTDRGQGIAADELPRIFNRFHRVAGKAGRGHGLGLYITAALARLHGGSVLATSDVGNGSTFTLVLPCRR